MIHARVSVTVVFGRSYSVFVEPSIMPDSHRRRDETVEFRRGDGVK